MENKKSLLLVYREKMAQVHTPEEIKAAFDNNSYAVCFNFDHSHIRAKYALFAAIWETNPDVIITETDLCIMKVEPAVWRDQLLLIDKNGTKETAKQIAKFMEECGAVSYKYRFVNKAGKKVCLPPVSNGKSCITLKGNLLIDGDKLLLTVRNKTKADREMNDEKKVNE